MICFLSVNRLRADSSRSIEDKFFIDLAESMEMHN